MSAQCWMPHAGTFIGWRTCRSSWIATRMDIVPELIDKAQKYSSHQVQFRVGDIVRSDLPKADLILCRDCLVHLSYKDIFECLHNFRRSGSTYLLTTTFPGQVRRHWNIATGMWRPIDLERPPFNFPKPLRLGVRPTYPKTRYSRRISVSVFGS